MEQKLRATATHVALVGAVLISWNTARAQSSQASPLPPSPPSWPAMAGPLAVNPNPLSYEAGPLGKVWITGAVTGLAQWQNSVFPGDRSGLVDLSSAQVFFNKTDGLVQFFVQLGTYSIPDLGLPYLRAVNATKAFYGPFPQGFLKLAPTKNLSIMAGKIPTLMGAEYTFAFENMNIERGLLWNQENAVNRGVLVNYTPGPVALGLSWNDGFYSNQYSWVWFSGAWTVNKSNTLAFIGCGNIRHSTISTTATPLFQNNEQMYDLIYTHTSGPWTIQPYLQYTHVPRIPKIGALHEASTYGVALLAKYSFAPSAKLGGVELNGFSLPVRLEYIGSTGSLANGAPNLMYGPGSKAWSATVTPTYQRNVFFARGEFSFVGTAHTIPGMALGPHGTDTSQARLLLEVGVLF
jgi:hypothetical protein